MSDNADLETLKSRLLEKKEDKRWLVIITLTHAFTALVKSTVVIAERIFHPVSAENAGIMKIMGIQIMQMRMNIMKHMKSRCITTPMNGEKITRMLTI